MRAKRAGVTLAAMQCDRICLLPPNRNLRSPQVDAMRVAPGEVAHVALVHRGRWRAVRVADELGVPHAPARIAAAFARALAADVAGDTDAGVLVRCAAHL